MQGAKTVESISNETGMSIANTSRHLQILKDGNLVINEKREIMLFMKLQIRR